MEPLRNLTFAKLKAFLPNGQRIFKTSLWNRKGKEIRNLLVQAKNVIGDIKEGEELEFLLSSLRKKSLFGVSDETIANSIDLFFSIEGNKSILTQLRQLIRPLELKLIQEAESQKNRDLASFIAEQANTILGECFSKIEKILCGNSDASLLNEIFDFPE